MILTDFMLTCNLRGVKANFGGGLSSVVEIYYIEMELKLDEGEGYYIKMLLLFVWGHFMSCNGYRLYYCNIIRICSGDWTTVYYYYYVVL